MAFRFHLPSKNLQPYIQGYLDADYRETISKGEHTLFPNGYSGVFFNFGNKGKLIINEEYKTPCVSAFGQIDHHFTVVHYPGFYSLGVLLKPTLLSWLLKVDMSSLTNKAVDGQLINRSFKELHERMEECSSIEDKIKLFENYFTKELVDRGYKVSLSDHALSLLNQNNTFSVQEIAKQLQVSQRYLESQFKKTVGLSPKTYSLIIRFKLMERQLKRSSTVRWQDMTFATEYYDQNHFIKDFKRFTGSTPSDYLLQNFDMGRSYLLSR